MRYIFLFVSFFSLEILNAKIRILTFHYNRSCFLEMQCKLFNHFLIDDYELIVFNDARDSEEASLILEICNRYGVQCIRFDQENHLTDPLNFYLENQLSRPDIRSHVLFHGFKASDIAENPSVRHCHVIQYALDHYGYDHDDIVVVCDGDAFPIRPMSIRNLLQGYDIIGARRHIWTENLDFLWVVFTAFNPRLLPNVRELKFHLDVINHSLCDSGSHTYHYHARYPYLRVFKSDPIPSSKMRSFDAIDLQHKGFYFNEIELIKYLPETACVEFFFDHSLFHFGASSFITLIHEEKLRCVSHFVDRALKDPVYAGIWGLTEDLDQL